MIDTQDTTTKTEQTWRLTFKDGTTMTVTAAPPEADGMWLEFTNVDGNKNLTLLARRAALVDVQLAPNSGAPNT